MKSPTPLPSLERLRELFVVSNEGQLIRRISAASNAKAGSVAGRKRPNSNGYYEVYVEGRLWLVHRIIWALTNGRDPGGLEVDHINRIKTDNRPSNLRLATASQQKMNTSGHSRNTSGVRGVSFNKSQKKWVAYLNKGSVTYWLGAFAHLDDAAAARSEAELEHFGSFLAEVI